MTIFDLFEYLDLPPLSPIDVVLSLGESPVRIDRHGRRFSKVFSPSLISLALCLDSGENFTLDLLAGWNHFDIPSGSQIALVGSPNVNIIHRVFDNVDNDV